MHTLVYLSAASSMFSPDDLVQILDISRKNNTSLGITGMLLYNDGSILQILEGEEPVLRPLYRKIQRDNRHKGVIKMLDCETTKRNFSEWSMGFKNVSNQDWSQVMAYLNIDNNKQFLTAMSSANEQIITIVKSFAHVNTLTLPVA